MCYHVILLNKAESAFHFLRAGLQILKLSEIRINDHFEGRNFPLAKDVFKALLEITLALKMKCLMRLVYN